MMFTHFESAKRLANPFGFNQLKDKYLFGLVFFYTFKNNLPKPSSISTTFTMHTKKTNQLQHSWTWYVEAFPVIFG